MANGRDGGSWPDRWNQPSIPQLWWAVENLGESLLAEMRPESLAQLTGSWQERKSVEMRTLILEAAIDCLVEGGYAGLSIQGVTRQAGISRGAMHHHFETKMQLVAALVEYTFYRRMQHFLADLYAHTSKGGDAVRSGAEMHWRSVQTREYAAYLALLVAARTDAELDRHFLPAARRFDRIWRERMMVTFPEWAAQLKEMMLANDFVVAMHLGLLLNRPVLRDGARMRDLHALVVKVVEQLYAEGPTVPRQPAGPAAQPGGGSVEACSSTK